MSLRPLGLRIWRWELHLAHRAGRVARWFVIEGRPALFGLIATAIAVLIFQNWSILAIYALVLVAWAAFQARRRVVVEEFVDHTVKELENGDARAKAPHEPAHLRGIATLLVVELDRLEQLYRVVDERRAIGTAVGEGRPLDATVKVEALSEILRSAVSAESKVSVGPITVPIGTLMALLGRLVQGPQLAGALHAHGDGLVLTAQLTGGSARRYSWRVERGLTDSDEIPADRSPLINEMIAELACRMFSDLTMGKSVNWRATHHFINALWAYRRCLRVPRARKLNLKEAERKLIEAFSEDDGFVLVFYNLGVVYTELWRMAVQEAKAMKEAYDLRALRSAEAKEIEAADQLQAAEAAFARAIDQDPGRWEAYYALALTRFERGRRRSVVEQCERVLALRPSRANRAKAYDLKGLAEFRRERPQLADATESSQKAAFLSLKALRHAELFRKTSPGSELDPVPPLRDQATRCLLNFATVLADDPLEETRSRIPASWRRRARVRRIDAIFRLALSLTNRDAVLHFEFGKIATNWGRLDIAAREFKAATRIDPDQAAYWARLAATYAQLFDDHKTDDAGKDYEREAAHACDRALQVINLSSRTDVDKRVRARLAHAYRKIGRAEDGLRVHAMGRFAQKIGAYEWKLRVSPEEVHKVEERLDRYRREGKNWESGHLARMLGVAKLNADDPKRAEEHFREAIELFEHGYSEEIRRYGIRARLATAVHAQGREEALGEAERALTVDPLRKLERKTLGELYFDLHDYENARVAWEYALLWSPNDPELYWNLSECHRLLAEEDRRPSERRKGFEQAAHHLEQALELYSGEELHTRLKAHYRLGRLYTNLGDFRKVIAHLRIVQTRPTLSFLADLLIGEAFLKVKAYEEAEELFVRVIEFAEKEVQEPGLPQVGQEVGDDVPVGLVLAWAYWGRAFCDADRDGDLERADADVDSAERLAQELETELAARGDANVRLAPILRSCSDCRGWIRLKQGRVDDAINQLGQAILRGAGSETYIRLALAYEAKAAASKKDLRPALFVRVRAQCAHAVDTDVTGESRALAEEILARLDARPGALTISDGAPAPHLPI
jgi:tetratricopeptide (TPR) repeat protein